MATMRWSLPRPLHFVAITNVATRNNHEKETLAIRVTEAPTARTEHVPHDVPRSPNAQFHADALDSRLVRLQFRHVLLIFFFAVDQCGRFGGFVGSVGPHRDVCAE